MLEDLYKRVEIAVIVGNEITEWLRHFCNSFRKSFPHVFKYLGANISANGDCMQDIRIRTATALRSMADLNKTWKGHGVSIPTKIRLYRALITVRVRQSFIMSPELFNLYLEHIMRVALSRVNYFDLNDDGKANIGGRRVDNLRFADDIALITKTIERAQELLQKVDEKSTRYSLEISQSKTQWMKARPKI